MCNSLWPPDSSSLRLLCPWGFSRQGYYSGLSCLSPGDLPSPGIKLRSLALQVDSLPTQTSGKPKNTGVVSQGLTRVSCIAGGFFNNWATRKAPKRYQFSSVSQSCPTLQPHGLQHSRLPCLSPTAGVYSNSYPLSRWSHPTISSSVIPFSSHLQSFPELGSFQMS